jgi:hypothetical protein
MVARKSDVVRKIKGGEGHKCHGTLLKRALPAALKRRKGQMQIVAHVHGADASSLSGTEGHSARVTMATSADGSALSADADPRCADTPSQAVGIGPFSAEAGHTFADAQSQAASPGPLSRDRGLVSLAAQSANASVAPLSDDGEATQKMAPNTALPPPSSPLSDGEEALVRLSPTCRVPTPPSIPVIRELARQRTDLLRAWQRLNNQIKAIERRGQTACDTQAPLATPSIADSAAPALVHCVETTMAARKAVEKQLEKLAKSLPVYETFTKPTKGLGAGGLALIIGETGDLSQYANPAKVWKRMGLAVIDGGRQRRVAGNADAALLHGYSPHRRQIMWNIGDSMIKVGDTYRQVYLDRKAYETAKNPDAAKIVHHRRAQRYMEKRILRNLWRAWRDLHGVTP